MAQLILTEEEKLAIRWSDLDDEALGKLVRKQITFIRNSSEQLHQCSVMSAALILCCSAHDVQATEAKFAITNVTCAGRPIGDWLITTKRVVSEKLPK